MRKYSMQTEKNSLDLFDSLKCPITYELFREPVIGSDGHTYERENIAVWIRKHGTSPITREPMNLNSLRPNYTVKKLVEDFMTLSLQKQYQFRLDIDVGKSTPSPIFRTSNKTIYQARWISRYGPPIVLIQINGAKAKCEAAFYVKLSCHPHIVRTYGLVDNHSSNNVMVVQEYAPEGDLNKILLEKNFRPTIEVLVEIFSQIVDAMICLADNQIIHGDLACRNVLVFRLNVNQPMEILVKLTDFGLTQTNSLFSIIDSPNSGTMDKIPLRSVAPEILRDTSAQSYSEKSDVYSFGVLMWEACSNGAMPYGELKSLEDVYQKRMSGLVLKRPSMCGDELWEIVLNCTQHEPQKRPDFKTIREDLLRLRYENQRASTQRISQVDSFYMNIPSKTSYSEKDLCQSFGKDAYVNVPIYNNLDVLSNVNAVYPADHLKKSICQYFAPCELCLESINQNDLEKHKNTCPVRCVAKSFVKSIVPFPLLELTSCPFCDNIIPFNMLRIHQYTCSKTAPWPNECQNLIRSPVQDSYPTITYLKPTPFLNPSFQQNIPEHHTPSDRPILRSNSNFALQVSQPNQSIDQQMPSPEIRRKSSKSGFRRILSGLKRKK